MITDFTRFESFIPARPPKHLVDLDPRLRIFADDQLEIWYAPLGDAVREARLWVLGLTPGWAQARLAYEAAAKRMREGATRAEAARVPKPEVPFAGTMRQNLVSMMDHIGISAALGVDSTSQLFGSKWLRTGSVLKYPVFKQSGNYSGGSPAPTRHPALVEMLDVVLAAELTEAGECLVLPLGKAAESCLHYSVDQGRVAPERVLFGFPHPSGANGHRLRQFGERRHTLSKRVEEWFGATA